jgi:phenylalanyl-tRNA synthetase beta chain
LFQIDLDDLLTVRLPRCEEISKYPEVRRDLAFFVGSSVSATTVVNCARGAAGSELVDIFVFDVYADDEPTQRKKSFALALIFQNKHRTLREDEIAQAVEQIVIAVSTQCDGELRG